MLPGANVLAPLAFVVANLLILWSGWKTDWKLGVAILIGYAILLANQVFHLNPIQPVFNWRSAQWLPVYLVGMGLIVFVSDFGPLTDPWLPLWWDMGVVAAFGLLIYYWALSVSLTTPQIERLIGEVVIPEEEGIA